MALILFTVQMAVLVAMALRWRKPAEDEIWSCPQFEEWHDRCTRELQVNLSLKIQFPSSLRSLGKLFFNLNQLLPQ